MAHVTFLAVDRILRARVLGPAWHIVICLRMKTPLPAMTRATGQGVLVSIALSLGLLSMAGTPARPFGSIRDDRVEGENARVDLGRKGRSIELLQCDAYPGSLTAHAPTVCHTGEPVNIGGVWNDPIIPPGFQGLFLLTIGPTQVIVQGATTPAFNVTGIDVYTIHPLVYDPATLDLGVFTFGQSTLNDVHIQLQQGGGTACGGLDMTGAPVRVLDCSLLCDAHSGTLTTATSLVCTRTGAAALDALPSGDTVVPEGFNTVYLVSSGSTALITSVGSDPHFDVVGYGDHTIHTLVYDPTTFDLAGIAPGSTTINALNALFIQGGGSVCGALDLAGVTIAVESCRPQNDDCANAAQLNISGVGDCNTNITLGDNTYATQESGDVPLCGAEEDQFADVWYRFNSGGNTEVSIVLGPISMSNWALTVVPTCGGSELACEIDPAVPIDVPTVPHTEYRLRIYSVAGLGGGGAFALCITGSQPTSDCIGGSVGPADETAQGNICKDGASDILVFVTTSHSTEQYAYVLSDQSDVIVSLMADNSMDLDALPIGSYRVWGISFKGELENADPGVPVHELTSTGACLDVGEGYFPIEVEVCTGLARSGAEPWNVNMDQRHGVLNVEYTGNTAMVSVDVLGMDGRSMEQQRTVMVQGQFYEMDLGRNLCQGVYTVLFRTDEHRYALRLFLHPQQ